MLGTTLNRRYLLEQLLHEGDEGSLFLATETDSGEMFAVRTLPAGADLRGEAGLRFLHLMRRIEGEPHSNLLTPIETATSEGVAYQVVPYYPAVPLHEALRGEPLTLTEGVELVRQVARGLGHLHALGVVHGGLAPANILVAREEGSLQAAVADAGMSLLHLGDFPAGGAAAAPFRAPEEIPGLDRPPDERSDLYALGMIGYLVLAGRAPFTGITVRQVLHRHLVEPPPWPAEFDPALPEPLASLLVRLVAKAPEERCQSAAEVVAVLDGWEREGDAAAQGSAPPRDVVPPPVATPPRIHAMDITGAGREVADEAAAAALQRTATGRGSLLTLVGEPGSGREALFERMAPAVLAADGLVLRHSAPAPGWSGPLAIPLGLLEDLRLRWSTLPELRRRYLAQRIETVMAGERTVLAELRPLLGDHSAGAAAAVVMPDGRERRRTLHLLAELFAVLAEPRHPLVLWLGALDDADADSLEWLTHLVHLLPETPLVALAAVTSEAGAPRVQGWLRRVAPYQEVREITLPPLAAPAVHALTAQRLGVGAEEPAPVDGQRTSLRVAEWLRGRWGGNPLAQGLALTTAAARGLLRWEAEAGRWDCAWDQLARLDLPETLDGLVEIRLGAVAEETRAVLEALAIFPSGAALADLSALLEHLPAERLLHQVELASELGLVRRLGGRLRFAHAAFHRVCYGALPDSRKDRHHRLLGAVMETGPAGPPAAHHLAIARHFALGGDTSRAARHAHQAGEAALRLHAPAGAAVALELARPWMEASPRRPALLIELAQARLMGGDPALALEQLQAARALALETPLLVRALTLSARAAHGLGDREAALTFVREGLGLLHERLPTHPLGAALAGLGFGRGGAGKRPGKKGEARPLEQREAATAELLELAARVLAEEEPRQAGWTDEKVVRATWGRAPEGFCVRALLRLARREGDPRHPYLQRAAGLLEAAPLPHEQGTLHAVRGEALLNQFDPREARDELFLAAEAFARLGDPLGEAEVLRSALDLARLQGPCGILLKEAGDLRRRALLLQSEQVSGWAEAFQGYARALTGKAPPDTAAEALAALALAARERADFRTHALALAMAAELWLALDRPAHAIRLFPTEPEGNQTVVTVESALAQAALAETRLVLARDGGEEGAAHLAEARRLIRGLREQERPHPRLVVETTLLEVLQQVAEGNADGAQELMASAEALLDGRGARLALGRLCARFADALRRVDHPTWPHWASKALSHLEHCGADLYARPLRKHLEHAAIPVIAPLPDSAGEGAPVLREDSAYAAGLLEQLEQLLMDGGHSTDALRRALLRRIVEVGNGEYGALFMANPHGKPVVVARIGPPQAHGWIHHALVDSAWERGEGEVQEKYQPSEPGEPGEAPQPPLQSAIALPLMAAGANQGVAYVGTDAARMMFDAADLQRIAPLARPAGAALAVSATLAAGDTNLMQLAEENRGWGRLAEWTAQALLEDSPQAILTAFLMEAAVPRGFSAALLYRADDASRRLLPVVSSFAPRADGAEHPRPGPIGLDHPPVAAALRGGSAVAVPALAEEGVAAGEQALLRATGLARAMWMAFPAPGAGRGALLLLGGSGVGDGSGGGGESDRDDQDVAALERALRVPLRLVASAIWRARQIEEGDGERWNLRERMGQSETERKRLERFVPMALRGTVGDGADPTESGVELWRPVVYGQIFDAARLSRLGKLETLTELQAYYTRIAEALEMHQGALEQITGHQWVARFEGAIENTLWGALTLHQLMLAFRDERSRHAAPALTTGVGIHLGNTIAGAVVTEQRAEPVLVGEGIQIAARLAEMCRGFRAGILLSDDMVQALDDPAPFLIRPLGMFRTSPGEKRVGVYELYAAREPEIRERMRERQDEWNAAMRHYQLGNWRDCAALLKSYLAHLPQDRPARHFFRLSRQKAGR